MIYYSSMSLEDYINVNWMELPRELVELFEREWERFIDQEEEIQTWRENYYELTHTVEGTIREMTRTLDDFVRHDITEEVMVEILRDDIDELDCAL